MLNMVCMKNHFKTVYSPLFFFKFVGIEHLPSQATTGASNAAGTKRRSQVTSAGYSTGHHATVNKQHLKCF